MTDACNRPCAPHEEAREGLYFVNGEPLDPGWPLTIVQHKPCGVETTRSGTGATVFDLLPTRFAQRRPPMQPIGRLDKDTSGLLLFTDDGELLHRLTHPRHHISKAYGVETARDIDPAAIEIFASGSLQLRSERTPLLPAELLLTGPRCGQLTLREGRYHQVRRMWAAVGNHVVRLHRFRVGPLSLGGLEEGRWRALTDKERGQLYEAVGLPLPAPA